MKIALKIFAICFLHCSISTAQPFSKKYFELTKWASNNTDSLFFKSDTVRLVKIIDDTYLTDGKSMDVDEYFGDANYLMLEFAKQNKLVLTTTNRNAEYIRKLRGSYTWDFNTSKKILYLYLNKKLLASFILISHSQRRVNIRGKYMDKPKVETIEISLKRNKL